MSKERNPKKEVTKEYESSMPVGDRNNFTGFCDKTTFGAIHGKSFVLGELTPPSAEETFDWVLWGLANAQYFYAVGARLQRFAELRKAEIDMRNSQQSASDGVDGV